MSVIDDLKSASLFGKLAFVFLAIASLFVCIAFTCTGWGELNTGMHWGLWRVCSENTYTPGCTPTDGWALDWWAATQALVIFGFFGILVSFFLVILYIFVGKCQKNSEVAMGAGIICIVTGVLYLIGCIVFAAEWDKNYKDTNTLDYFLSYAFGLSIVALILEIVAGVFLILEGKGKGVGQNPA
ncbi:hypothetical protein KUTeg_014467 [Tegillarca granosa]|uniref:Uncharacterized protein n=1 Tax=Tegillarca granosa TaxID=220873 RepID=A0ABQ9EWP3_TEGGR|nr:hypothetical protein KUTeg_014467 [Tegillarca granosa]